MSHLPTHSLGIVLIQPQIAPNTGNIARLCVTMGAELHLVRPLGFLLSDKQLKRSAMDYWDRLKLTIHDDLDAFAAFATDRRIWLCENGSSQSIWDIKFEDGDLLIFGSEGPGIPKVFIEMHADKLIGIPQVENERCLNISTAAGMVLGEAIRQIAVNQS